MQLMPTNLNGLGLNYLGQCRVKDYLRKIIHEEGGGEESKVGEVHLVPVLSAPSSLCIVESRPICLHCRTRIVKQSKLAEWFGWMGEGRGGERER